MITSDQSLRVFIMKMLVFLISTITIVIMLSKTHLKAQQQEPIITIVRHVDLSADKVWEQLRIMDNIDKLTSLVSEVKWTGNYGVGGERVCTSADGQGFFKESIVKFSDAERSYSYAVVEGVPAQNMVNNFKVIDLGYNKSMIIWTTTFQFMENPQMTEDQFKGFLENSVHEMITNTIAFADKA